MAILIVTNFRERIWKTIGSRVRGAIRLALLAAAVASVLSTTISAQDSKAAVIMFEGLRDPTDFGSNAIYSVNTDGTNLKRLTGNGDSIFDTSPFPQWSPDGQQIAFVNWTRVDDGGSIAGELYVMDHDGSNRRLLIHVTTEFGRKAQSISGLAWSPDGKTLAVARLVSGLFSISLDKPGEPRIVFQPKSSQDVSSLVWSPDSKKIAFYSHGQSSEGGEFVQASEVHVVDADGSSEIMVGRSVVQSRMSQQSILIRWSADGTKVFFPLMVATPSGSAAIRSYESNADGSGEMQESKRPVHENLSPDGRRIAFVDSEPDRPDGVFVMNKDGSGVRRATNDPDWACTSNAWTPDGHQLVLSCHYVKVQCKMVIGCNWRLFVISADSLATKLTPILDVDARFPSVAPVR